MIADPTLSVGDVLYDDKSRSRAEAVTDLPVVGVIPRIRHNIKELRLLAECPRDISCTALIRERLTTKCVSSGIK